MPEKKLDTKDNMISEEIVLKMRTQDIATKKNQQYLITFQNPPQMKYIVDCTHTY